MKRLGAAIAALAVGSLIYLLWRPRTLTVFTWLDVVGGERVVGSIRFHASWFFQYLPGWVLYSLPSALWIFSGLLLFDLIWGGKSSAGKKFWSLLLWFIALGGEFGQSLQIVPGSFDPQDIYLMLISGGLAHLSLLYLASPVERGKNDIL